MRELAADAGVGDRISFRPADLVADPAAAEPVDLVVLNQVVCCTPDGLALVGIAASLARRTLVLSFPRAVWWARAGLGVVNLFFRLRRRRFRVFVHSRRPRSWVPPRRTASSARPSGRPAFPARRVRARLGFAHE